MKNPRITAKERGLLKGAIRRVFSRSELRKAAIAKNSIDHFNPDRPRVTKWSFCTECGTIDAQYLMDVDHREPVVPIDRSFADMSMDEALDRQWCELEKLDVLCSDCHDGKTAIENKERRRIKKGKE